MSLGGRGVWVAVILVVALAIRVGFVVSHTSFRPFADAASYDHTAVALAVHGSYPQSAIAPSGGPTAFRPPAYPFLLAGLYVITGTTHSASRFEVARLLSAVLSTGIVAVIGLIAFVLWGGGAPTLVSMGLAAVYPPLITLGDAMLSEPLFSLLVLAALAAILMARRSGRPLRWAALAGIAVGLAALTRSNGIVIALPLAAGLLRPSAIRSSLAPVAALVVAVLLVVTPWVVRNSLVFHRFVPISTQAGFTLAGAYNQASRSDHGRWIVPLMPPYNRLLRAGENEEQLEQRFRSTALAYIGNHPAYVLEVGYYNLGRLLEFEGPGFEHAAAGENGVSNAVSDLDVYSFYVLAALAVVAAALGGLRRVPLFVWGVPLVLALSLVFVIADMRYRLPIDPFLILLVAAGLVVRLRAARSLPLSVFTRMPRGELP